MNDAVRCAWCTRLLRAGAPLPVIAANLGHSDARMTERHYAHLVPSHVAQVIRAAMPKLGLIEPNLIVMFGQTHRPALVRGEKGASASGRQPLPSLRGMARVSMSFSYRILCPASPRR
jgi:hypothetical protein